MEVATVSVEEVNSGAMVERDLCLTIALGASAAAECGDLRIVHALPTLRTLNRARAPVVLSVAGKERARKSYPGVDQPHSIKRGNSIHYSSTEFPGNVVGLIGSQKELANEYAYTPWGEAESVRESVPNMLRFQARELDGGTGMYYFRSRWYDPQLWRFNSEDPIGLEGGINLYAFTRTTR